MPTTDKKDSKPSGSWKESLKTVFLLVYLVAFTGILALVNTYYVNLEKLADIVGGLVVLLFIGGLLVYVFWVGLKAIFSGKDKE